MEINQALCDFLNHSPTCYHAVANLQRILTEAGYQRLRESEVWSVKRGGKYFVLRGGSSLIAFRVPQGEAGGFQIAAAHSDSPSYKLRQQPETAAGGGCTVLSVEPYGGMRPHSWLDRPLSLAGRCLVGQGGRFESRLVDLHRPLCIIPSVAVHLDREANRPLNAAADLRPLFTQGETKLKALLARELDVSEETILETELFLYPWMEAMRLGAEGEFLASPRLDDLQCVFGCLQGFLQAREGESIPVLAVFNNEEVGSTTRQGADSTFLTDVLERLGEGCGWTKEAYRAAISRSFLVSADNAHAVHPNHPEFSDKTDAPVLNGGVVIKYNANQRYTTDGLSAAVFSHVAEKAGVQLQRYSNRADLPGGSTLGNISTSHLSIPAVDIGLPQLSMHSSVELAGSRDTEALVQVMTAYYGCALRPTADGMEVV